MKWTYILKFTKIEKQSKFQTCTDDCNNTSLFIYLFFLHEFMSTPPSKFYFALILFLPIPTVLILAANIFSQVSSSNIHCSYLSHHFCSFHKFTVDSLSCRLKQHSSAWFFKCRPILEIIGDERWFKQTKGQHRGKTKYLDNKETSEVLNHTVS